MLRAPTVAEGIHRWNCGANDEDEKDEEAGNDDDGAPPVDSSGVLIE